MLTFILFLTSIVYAQCSVKGKSVTATGYIMDNLCIQKKFLVDNPTVLTLSPKGPKVHSLKCLATLQNCVDSGFALLQDPVSPKQNYTVKYQLGAAGTKMAVDLAMKAMENGAMAGFRATVTGVETKGKQLACLSIKDVTKVTETKISKIGEPTGSAMSSAVSINNALISKVFLGLASSMFFRTIWSL